MSRLTHFSSGWRAFVPRFVPQSRQGWSMDRGRCRSRYPCGRVTVEALFRPFKLASLSTVTEENRSNRAVTVFVNLRSKQPNQVAVFNWGTYDVFGVYKKQATDILYSRYAMLFSGPKQDVSSTVVMFSDSLSSSLEDRYEVRPVVSGQELPALPIEYVTDDTAYYNRIEGKNSPR